MRTCLILVLCLVSATPAALACLPPPPSARTFADALKTSTSTFVFRLDSATYVRQQLGSSVYTEWVDGEITVIQTLHGNPTGYRTLRFYSGWCGGVNLVVGHHYLIATHARGPRIELDFDDPSLFDLDGFYDPARKQRNLRSVFVLPVIQALYAGKPLPVPFPPTNIAARTVPQPDPTPTAPIKRK
ncbi:hypothetical protein [Stenotrophomonas sp. YIM B06876]|uniref:hypothetical protein n=1 Tax=Stenotrophomonas sp. YIM B06876 TaxID=3060211 RepID=UPI002739E641|nr:hypothetical protein [Stenotrophomonas sp. YIM B06876]